MEIKVNMSTGLTELQDVYVLRIDREVPKDEIKQLLHVILHVINGKPLVVIPLEASFSNYNYFTFEVALPLMRAGKKVARKDWAGEYYLQAVPDPSGGQIVELYKVGTKSFTAWNSMHTDVFADDWYLFEDVKNMDG